MFFLIFILAPVPPSSASEAGDSAALLAEGIAYYEDESYEEALESLQGVLFLDPGSIEAAYYTGLTYKEMLVYPKALEYLERTILFEASNLDAQAVLGEVFYALGRYDEAEAALKRAEGSKRNFAHITFIRGLISMEREDYKDAVEELEASGSVQGAYKNKADYYLALAYLKLGEDDKAEGALMRVAEVGDDPILARQAGAILKKIKGSGKDKRALKLSVSYSVEVDDNVILKPSEEISGITITGEDDITHKVSLRAAYKFSLGRSSLNAGYSYFQSIHNTQSSIDLMGHSISLAHVTPTNRGEFTVPVSFSFYHLDFNPYLKALRIGPAYGYNFDRDNWLIINLTGSVKDFLIAPSAAPEERDALNLQGGLSFLSFFKERRGSFNLGFAFDIEDTEGSNWSYIGVKGFFALLYPLSETVDFQATGQYYNQVYRNSHTVYGEKRTDNILRVEPKVTFHFAKTDLHFRYLYSKSSSNIGVYDYTRNLFGTGVEYKF